MATGQGNTNTYTSGGYTFKWCTLVDYNVTNTSDTEATYTVTVKAYHINTDTTKRVSLNSGVKATLLIDGVEVSSYTSTSSHTLFAGEANAWTLITYTGSATRTRVQQTRSITATIKLTNWGSGTSTYSGSSVIVIPPETSYVIAYNNNGGDGTIASDTKWHDESLTLSDGTGFTKTNYDLLGWNTAADGTGTHYALGGAYTANAAATLYAEWTLSAVAGYARVNGSIKTGIFYARVNGNIVTPHLGYVKVGGVWKQIM